MRPAQRAIDSPDADYRIGKGKPEPVAIPPVPEIPELLSDPPVLSRVDMQMSPFVHIFGCDLRGERERDVPAISSTAYGRLNRSARTERLRQAPPARHPSSQTTRPKRAAPARAHRRRDAFEGRESESDNERRLRELMEEQPAVPAAGEWEAHPGKGSRQRTYAGRTPRTRKPRAPIHIVDPKEPASVRLRNQCIRQTIAIREAAEVAQEADDAEYRARVWQIESELTPYLRYLEELEAAKPMDPQKMAQMRQLERERLDELRAIRDSVEQIPNLVGHTAVLMEFQSEENRARKEEQKERTRVEEEAWASRGKFKEQLYREWRQ
jgi:hypothetical protein